MCHGFDPSLLATLAAFALLVLALWLTLDDDADFD